MNKVTLAGVITGGLFAIGVLSYMGTSRKASSVAEKPEKDTEETPDDIRKKLAAEMGARGGKKKAENLRKKKQAVAAESE